MKWLNSLLGRAEPTSAEENVQSIDPNSILFTYLRKVKREPLLSGKNPVAQLAGIVGSKIGPAPVLFSSSSYSGRVKDGFTINVGKGIELYGFIAYGMVPVVAASVGSDPDDGALVTAFSKLNEALGLVLVDWKAQFILVDTNAAGQIQVWRPSDCEHRH